MSRRWRIETALSSLMRERGIATLDELISLLVMGTEPSLSQKVVEALLNNETYFFRDRRRSTCCSGTRCRGSPAPRRDKRLRIWSRRLLDRPGSLFAGDAVRRRTGAMARLDDRHPRHRRVDARAIDRARAGVYTQFEVQRGLGDQPDDPLVRGMRGDGWRAVEPLRKPVRFQVHNMLEPPPHPGGFDIVLCRNVLLYLSPDKKALAFERLAAAMAEDGWLMLGAGETVIGQTSKLGADINARGLYRSSATAAGSRSARATQDAAGGA